MIARAEDDFLVAQGMNKGTMALIDEARAQAIYAAIGPAMETLEDLPKQSLASRACPRGIRRQGER